MSKMNLRQRILVQALAGVLAITGTSLAQPAKGANKFLGNITTHGQVRTDFNKYWNQITGENEHKWQSVENTRNTMKFTGGDNIVKYASEKGMLWKFHTLVWGSQYPGYVQGNPSAGWLMQLSTADQKKEIVEWYDKVKEKYPEIPMIDVVNEAQPGHAPAPFKDALGGDGETGFDWIINAFKMARERWPKAILIYNDYNNCEYGGSVDWTIKLVNAMLKAKAPIDAIGCQGHDTYKLPTSAVKSNLDKIAATGLPIFISEFDIGEGDDTKQKKIMEEQFTMFWNHPSVVGVTYWGYVLGATWRPNTGLMNSNGTERPALTWLKEYVKNNPNPPNDFPGFLKGESSGYHLGINVKGQGTVTRTPDETRYAKDTEVTLTATPAKGWVFSGWDGAASGTQNPLKITMSEIKKITAKFVTEDGKVDLIANGTFSAGEASWYFNNWSGSGEGIVVDGEYKLSITTIGTNNYDIQTVQSGIILEKGKTYRVSFDAYASEDRAMSVNVGMPESPYTTFLTTVSNGSSEVALTTTKKGYSFDFTMEQETYENSRIEFSVGLATPTVYIDNVSLYEAGEVAVHSSVQNKPAQRLNVSQHGSLVHITSNYAGNRNASLNIYDLRGNIVRSERFTTIPGVYSLSTSGISKGYYIIKVRIGNSVFTSDLMLTGK